MITWKCPVCVAEGFEPEWHAETAEDQEWMQKWHRIMKHESLYVSDFVEAHLLFPKSVEISIEDLYADFDLIEDDEEF